MFRKVFGRTFALMAMLAVMASSAVMPAAAEVETIEADLGRCRTNIFDYYQIQLQSGDTSATARDLPTSVTLTFVNGESVTATPRMGPNFGTIYYYYTDTDGRFEGVEVDTAIAQLDTERFPNYRFTVSARPCVPEPEPTFTVSGTILQHGNQKPVEGLEVCIVETDACTTTDANGHFSITGVESGTYTLSSDGPVYKPLSTSVTVDGADVYFDLTQYRGGGRN